MTRTNVRENCKGSRDANPFDGSDTSLIFYTSLTITSFISPVPEPSFKRNEHKSLFLTLSGCKPAKRKKNFVRNNFTLNKTVKFSIDNTNIYTGWLDYRIKIRQRISLLIAIDFVESSIIRHFFRNLPATAIKYAEVLDDFYEFARGARSIVRTHLTEVDKLLFRSR